MGGNVKFEFVAPVSLPTELEGQISRAMQRDRHRLRNLLRAIRKAERQGKSDPQKLARFTKQLEQSVALYERRSERVPTVELNPQLPITAKATEISEAIQTRQVIVVCGETGSGKSTQLPKLCLAAGRGIRGFIGHTQPRRLAARSISARLIQELGGDKARVGFKVRFTDTVSPETYIKLMTDGILLAETQGDRFLDQYDTIILDEAHERSLNIDFLLGYFKTLLPKRPDLRLIITSATIDAERFSEHFADRDGPAPVILVSGRTYPVETRYRPCGEDEAEESVSAGIVAALEELSNEPPGDVLVFLPTERDIREVARRLRGWALKRSSRPQILPLYARLSAADQNRVFQVGRGQRVVLATNVAESSLTVPGIRYVVDSGTARISRYSARSKVQRLPIEPISRASADQRQGRCGRVAPGVCIRLYSEQDYLDRDEYATPEIRRTNLASVVLQMLTLRLGEVAQFPFLDPPRPEVVRDGYKTLFELGAIDGHRNLTELGRKMSRLPVDPRIAKMLLAADEENCLAEVLIIAAALEIQDPRERPADKQAQADQSHAKFQHEDSDFLSYLKLWDFIQGQKAQLSRNQQQKSARQNFLSFNRLREWQDLHRQLKQLVEANRMQVRKRQDEYDPIHRALLSGTLANVALRKDRNEYQAAGGAKSFLWPGSGIFSKRPQWVMAAEAIETSRRYLRTAAKIDPRWIEKLAEHLVKRSYGDPYWSKKRGTVMASEKVTLFGLVVVPARPAPYGPVDPVRARALFIEDALVSGNVRLGAKFFQHNQEVMAELESLAAKSRRSSLLVGGAVQFTFYDERLPEDVFDVVSLKAWLKRASNAEADRLKMQPADLVPEYSEAGHVPSQFPDAMAAGGVRLNIEYRYQPGDDDDGMSVTVPVEAASQVERHALEWGVPGLLEEKVLALIRSLPKSLRRCLVPAPDSARAAVEQLTFGAGPLLPALAEVLSRLAGEPIAPTSFDWQKVPYHLQVNVRVVDDGGEVVAEGRDVAEVWSKLPRAADTAAGTIRESSWERTGITQWDFGELPTEIRVDRGGIQLSAYPMLVDRGEHVDLALGHHPQMAREVCRGGLRRLICLRERSELKSQVNWLPRLSEMQLFAATLPYELDLRSELTLLLADRSYLSSDGQARTAEEFEQLCVAGRRQLPVAIQDLAKLMWPLWESYHQVCLRLEEVQHQSAWADTVADVREQLAQLTSPKFLVATPWDWLQQYPRFLRAMQQRLEKLSQSGHSRDVEGMRQVRPFVDRYQAYCQALGDGQPPNVEVETYRWMLEEFRVSIFCQTLGTSIKVSPQRLDKQWSKANAGS